MQVFCASAGFVQWTQIIRKVQHIAPARTIMASPLRVAHGV